MSYQTGVPRVETQRSDQVSDVSQQSASSDLMVNNLVYKQPKALSLAVNRTMNRMYPQKNDYKNGETMILDSNSGTAYIDPANSYLTFDMTIQGEGTAGFGTGAGALNLIRDIRIRSRTGVELDRCERLNLYSKHAVRMSKTENWVNTIGSMFGMLPNDQAVLADDTYAVNSPQRFCIPMGLIAGFFRPIKDGQLIPPQYASGLHVEIVWENYTTALFGGGDAITGYTISNVQFMYDSVEMSDDVQKTINYESASNGLEYAYPRVYTTTTSHPSNQTNISIQIRKAVSQSSCISTLVMNQGNQQNVNLDSMSTMPFDVERWYYRLGAQYFPHQEIVDTTGSGTESMYQAMVAFNKVKKPFAEGTITRTDFNGAYGSITTTLEKNQMLNLSGLPINSSRVLELLATLSVSVAQREIVSFMDYVSVSKSFLDNVAVAL